MENISNVRLTPLPPESHCQLIRLRYTQNGKEKNWDFIKTHNSVAIIIYNSTRNKLVFVKQFRPAVYYGQIKGKIASDTCEIDTEKYPANLGITLELCGRKIDKTDESLANIVLEEILKVGYQVATDRLERVITYRSGLGTIGAEAMFYCKVTDDDKISTGGRVDDDTLQIVEYSIEAAKKLMAPKNNITSPPGFLFGVCWFLSSEAPKFLK